MTSTPGAAANRWIVGAAVGAAALVLALAAARAARRRPRRQRRLPARHGLRRVRPLDRQLRGPVLLVPADRVRRPAHRLAPQRLRDIGDRPRPRRPVREPRVLARRPLRHPGPRRAARALFAAGARAAASRPAATWRRPPRSSRPRCSSFSSRTSATPRPSTRSTARRRLCSFSCSDRRRGHRDRARAARGTAAAPRYFLVRRALRGVEAPGGDPGAAARPASACGWRECGLRGAWRKPAFLARRSRSASSRPGTAAARRCRCARPPSTRSSSPRCCPTRRRRPATSPRSASIPTGSATRGRTRSSRSTPLEDAGFPGAVPAERRLPRRSCGSTCAIRGRFAERLSARRRRSGRCARATATSKNRRRFRPVP